MNDAIKAVMPVRREIQIKEKKRVIPIPTREDLRKIREELAGKHQTARVRIIDALLQAEDYADGWIMMCFVRRIRQRYLYFEQCRTKDGFV